MRRRIYAIVAALAASLLLMLCAATLVLWVRSYWQSDLFWTGYLVRSVNEGTRAQFVTGRGVCLIKWDTDKNPASRGRVDWGHAPLQGPQDFVRGNWRFWATNERRSILGVIIWGRAKYGSSGSGL